MRRGLTLAEAQAHCSDDRTRDPASAWFDGYEQVLMIGPLVIAACWAAALYEMLARLTA